MFAGKGTNSSENITAPDMDNASKTMLVLAHTSATVGLGNDAPNAVCAKAAKARTANKVTICHLMGMKVYLITTYYV